MLQAQDSLKQKYRLLFPHLNEKTKRMVCAADAKALGHGGVKQVQEASGLSRVSINKGHKELENHDKREGEVPSGRIRKEGGGRKPLTEKQQTLKQELEKLIAPYTRGDPENPLRWTTKSLRNLEAALKQQSYKISYGTIRDLLKELGYSLQSQSKVKAPRQRQSVSVYQ